jgi:SAM-dependent methyltransferase
MIQPDAQNQRMLIERRWSSPNSGSNYSTDRWRNPRAKQRDGRLLTSLLTKATLGPGPLLDAPCGTGRLQTVLRGLNRDSICLDLSAAMLKQVETGARLQGSAFALPFKDHSFPLVTRCHLLHHLAGPADQAVLLRELARVSAGWVAVSHWDAASWHVLRRRMGWRKGHDHRVGLRRRELIELGLAAGLERCWSRSSLRFISPQTWTLFKKQPRNEDRPSC